MPVSQVNTKAFEAIANYSLLRIASVGSSDHNQYIRDVVRSALANHWLDYKKEGGREEEFIDSLVNLKKFMVSSVEGWDEDRHNFRAHRAQFTSPLSAYRSWKRAFIERVSSLDNVDNEVLSLYARIVIPDSTPNVVRNDMVAAENRYSGSSFYNLMSQVCRAIEKVIENLSENLRKSVPLAKLFEGFSEEQIVEFSIEDVLENFNWETAKTAGNDFKSEVLYHYLDRNDSVMASFITRNFREASKIKSLAELVLKGTSRVELQKKKTSRYTIDELLHNGGVDNVAVNFARVV